MDPAATGWSSSALSRWRKVEVQLGGPAGEASMQLEVYTRWEEGRWKIYRVRDLGNQFEQPIYSAGDIAHAKAWSAEIATGEK